MKLNIMKVTKTAPIATTLTIGILIGFSSNAILAGASGPKEHKGIEVGSLEVIPESSLKATIGLEGYVLRMRKVTVMPGGQIAQHSHADRPGIVTMVDGNWIEGKPSGENSFSAKAYGSFPEKEDTISLDLQSIRCSRYCFSL